MKWIQQMVDFEIFLYKNISSLWFRVNKNRHIGADQKEGERLQFLSSGLPNRLYRDGSAGLARIGEMGR
jgi:hypothetical protein